MNINRNTEEKEKNKRHTIQIVVDEMLKQLWDSLDMVEKRAFTRFFKSVVASYAKTKSFVPLDAKSLSDSLDVCKKQLDVYRDRVAVLEKQLSEQRSAVESIRARVGELERDIKELEEERKKEVESIDAAYRDKIEKLMKEVDRWRSAYQNTKQIILALCNTMDIVPSSIKKDIEFYCTAEQKKQQEKQIQI